MRITFWTAVSIAAVASVAVLLAAVDPAESIIFPPCPWRTLTGWLCPGCGSARAMHALLHGHLGIALQMNPLAVAAVPFAATDTAMRSLGRPGPIHSLLRPWVIYAIGGSIVAFGIARNL